MKQVLIQRIISFLAFALVLSALPSCSEDWDDHYDRTMFDLPEVTLNQYIQGKENLSIFASMLKSTGYDTIIGASQSFTVWAPTNEALAGIDLNDKELVFEIVKNHLARSTYSTAGVTTNPVYMINNKFIAFSRESSSYYFGKIGLLDANVATKNGLVHVINGYAPYAKNIWEYISRTQGLDSLKAYIESKNERTFDPSQSEIISYDGGDPIYDSVFVETNWLFERIGLLNDEDSTYTAILPNNQAWEEAYGRSFGFFNIRTQDGGVVRQRDYAKQAIVRDLIFSGKYDNTSALDSLVSTLSTVFYNPGYLFENTEPIELSNGLAYVAPQLNYSDTSSWYKERRVEAEYTTGRVPFNCSLISKTSYGSGHKISKNRYIEAQFVSGSESYVSFTIPNTLSATYNIYCVFAPSNIENALDLLPVKTRFRLQIGRTGFTTILANRNFPHISSYITDPKAVTKMFVGTYTFQYANLLDEDYPESYATTTFRVYNDGIGNSTQYNPNMRIDCIILEPVK